MDPDRGRAVASHSLALAATKGKIGGPGALRPFVAASASDEVLRVVDAEGRVDPKLETS